MGRGGLGSANVGDEEWVSEQHGVKAECRDEMWDKGWANSKDDRKIYGLHGRKPRSTVDPANTA